MSELIAAVKFKLYVADAQSHQIGSPPAQTPPQQTNGQLSTAASDSKSLPTSASPSNGANGGSGGSSNTNVVDEVAAHLQQLLVPPSSLIATPIAPIVDTPVRNYASRECGAKVLHANEEAEHRNAILNDRERDEYTRMPCQAKNKFLIIELCETIQVSGVLFNE